MTSGEASARVLTTPREASQARAVVDGIRELDGGLSIEREGERVAGVPPELGRVLQQVLEALASGRTVTVGTLPEVVTTSTAASLLGVSRPTLMKLIRGGHIPAHKVGSHHRLLAEDVLEYRRAQRAEARAAFDALRELDDSVE